MKRTTCPHCGATNEHADSPATFTRADCSTCGRAYLRRPASKHVAVVSRRFNGHIQRHEVTGALTSAGFLPGAVNF